MMSTLQYRMRGIARRRANRQNFEFDITCEWVKEKLAKGVCEATGIPFVDEPRHPYRPSIDRIDNVKGYLKSNCQVVVYIYNLSKHIWTHTEVMDFVYRIKKHPPPVS